MKKLTFLITTFTTALVWADSVSIQCGKTKKDQHEVEYQSEGMDPDEREDWGLYLYGKERKRSNSVTVKKKERIVTELIVTDKKPAKKDTYLQFVFTDMENCGDGDKPVFVQKYQVGGGQGREKVGDKLKCECDVD